MNKDTYIYINRIIAWFLALITIIYIGFANTLPFGKEVVYTNFDNSISPLGPVSRIELTDINDVQVTKQKDDLIYFYTIFPFPFDKAKVKITLKNLDPLQMLELGYRDELEWHYDMKTIDASIFHNPDWKIIDGNPNLFQRYNRYNTIEELLIDSPTVVGALDYNFESKEEIIIPRYISKNVDTIIDVPLRGSHIMYMYVQDEPFRLTVKKQDLNWYEDPDIMEIRVYKDNDIVFTSMIDDDGITDNSKAVGMIQEAIINNPGPGLPENGVYKVVFDANGDTVIKNIRTNLSKIVFVGSVFPISNSVVYPEFIQKTSTTTLYTNSNMITTLTYHDATQQKIIINDEIYHLNETRTLNKIDINNEKDMSKILFPQSDIVVSSMGYLAFSKDQFFIPNKLNLFSITPTTDFTIFDYIITPYKAPLIDENGYFIIEREFDLTSAVPVDGRLGWMIRAQGLKENNREVIINDIKITYTKEGWWKK